MISGILTLCSKPGLPSRLRLKVAGWVVNPWQGTEKGVFGCHRRLWYAERAINFVFLGKKKTLQALFSVFC